MSKDERRTMNQKHYEQLRRNVEAGYGNYEVFKGRTIQDELIRFARKWEIDPEEANLAIIAGTRKRAEIVLRYVSDGYVKLHWKEFSDLVRRSYIDPEEANLALIEGRGR